MTKAQVIDKRGCWSHMVAKCKKKKIDHGSNEERR